MALHLQKNQAFQALRGLIGAEDPQIAKTLDNSSLRAVYGTDRIKNGFYFSDSVTTASREIQFFFPESISFNVAVIEPFPTTDYAKTFLEDAIYPTLLTGLTALCKEKPANPTVIVLI